jgi:hypothetical protein
MKIKKGGQLSHVHQNGINNQKSLDYINYYFFTPKQTKDTSSSSSSLERERKQTEIKLRLKSDMKYSKRRITFGRVFWRYIRDSDGDFCAISVILTVIHTSV